MTSGTIHTPVLPVEAIEALQITSGATIVDGTAGGGGHVQRMLARVGPSGRVIAIDRDPDAVERLRARFSDPRVQFFENNYADLPELLDEIGLRSVDGILLDLGLSSDQLADRQRGFSFESDGPLDLRFDPRRGEPAYRLINRLSSEHLADLIYQYGEERLSRRIARAIVARRQEKPIDTATELAEIVRRAYPPASKRGEKIAPATRTFQALRIAVNDELKALETALRRFPEIMETDGKLAIISFHSLEDRQVKQAFRDDERYEALTRKPIRPNEAEIIDNPRSRSAKLRVARRLS
ncbi:MAG TPA: 16S rRNA (cytosine(1402)-N(4))-methyltransferase RsmH [Planctomycetes bacterium]|nr:16S rRNA (cytosine(1402)-N(4))-methyltransferase RsmH [Planctomycetaceae bacterium]HIM31518.1 16S rRNA (cytosine(1402)-N(4))-methyltransferase RsmH [Planctomycetota bacterium]